VVVLHGRAVRLNQQVAAHLTAAQPAQVVGFQAAAQVVPEAKKKSIILITQLCAKNALSRLIPQWERAGDIVAESVCTSGEEESQGICGNRFFNSC